MENKVFITEDIFEDLSQFSDTTYRVEFIEQCGWSAVFRRRVKYE